MKTSQILIGVGAALALSLLAWQLYMVQTPPYKRTYQRGLSAEFKVAKDQVKKTETSDSKSQKKPDKTGSPDTD